MQFFLSGLLVLVSLGIIIFLLSKKWRQLSLLDVDSIPEVKEEKKKNEYLKRRVEQRSIDSKSFFVTRAIPLINKAKEIQLRFRKYVGKIEREVFGKEDAKKKTSTKNDIVKPADLSSLRLLLQEAADAVADEDWHTAEQKYIAAISLDGKNLEAYRGLADLYLEQEQYAEAEETYKFILQLDPDNDNVYVKLGELAELQHESVRAVEYYQQAVIINPQLPTRFFKLAELLSHLKEFDTAFEAIEQALDIEPENPRYLDSFAELAILVGDQNAAKEGYDRLRMVNPENKKLPVIEDKIRSMGKSEK